MKMKNTLPTEENSMAEKAFPENPKTDSPGGIDPKSEKKRLKKEAKEAKKKAKSKKKEGRRVRSMSPMSVFTPFIMKKRNDACNFFSDEFDITAAEDYIHQKRREGLKGFGFMHLIIAAYVRSLADKPGINRFIRGQRVWARNNIEVCLTIKREMKLNADDTCVKFFPEVTDTAEEIYRRIEETIRAATENANTDFDKTARALTRIPRFLIRGTVSLLSFLDYYGLLPRFLTKVSPFHGSLFITSMGSLGIRPIYHHIYNFGNVPVFVSFGKVEREYRIQPDGSVAQKRTIGLKVVCDERICDGFYYASFFKSIKNYFSNPTLLDEPPATVVEDIP